MLYITVQKHKKIDPFLISVVLLKESVKNGCGSLSSKLRVCHEAMHRFCKWQQYHRKRITPFLTSVVVVEKLKKRYWRKTIQGHTPQSDVLHFIIVDDRYQNGASVIFTLLPCTTSVQSFSIRFVTVSSKNGKTVMETFRPYRSIPHPSAVCPCSHNIYVLAI